MTFKTILTNVGLREMAQADVAGTPINIVAVSVGDGGGNPTTPNQAQTQLVREVYRTAPNRVYQDPTNALQFIIEMVIPASVGGFTIQEVGAWDANGNLFAVANTPAVYKPEGDGSEGSYGDTTIRMQFLVTNASVVTLQVDPNVAVATQSWINNTITLPYLLPGGTTGQILAKKSNSDGDVVWQSPTVANVSVSTYDEVQTLAAGQTAVTLTKCNTVGLAVYINGLRLLPTDWTPIPTNDTQLTLAVAYAAGTVIHFVQNEPAAFVPDPLLAHNNLADVTSASTARTNLGVDAKTNTDTHAPPGLVAFFAGAGGGLIAPNGWMRCNGAAVSRTAYSALFAVIGTLYGNGDGLTTFNLPDMRGEFVRGFDDSRGVDPGRTLGSWQDSANLAHAHNYSDPGHQHQYTRINGDAPMAAGGTDAWTGVTTALTSTEKINITIQNSGGSESRPKNLAMLACIKY
jgi:phage-related tail fiber protein